MVRLFGICLVMFLVACGGGVDKKSDSTGSSDPSGGSSSSGGSETYTPPASSNGSGGGGSTTVDTGTGVSCSGLDDCAYWYCRCEDGGLVNASNCVNNYCATADSVCPDACETFNHGEWTGVADGGPNQSMSSGGGDDGGSGGSSGGGSSSGDICPGADPSFDNGTECSECTQTYCCEELSACSGNPECLNYVDCVLDGNSTDDCDFFYPEGEYDFDRLFRECNQAMCSDLCL